MISELKDFEIKIPKYWNEENGSTTNPIKLKGSLESKTLPAYLRFINFKLKNGCDHEIKEMTLTINLDTEKKHELIYSLSLTINDIDISIKTYPIIKDQLIPILLDALTTFVELLDVLDFDNTSQKRLKQQMVCFLEIQNALLKAGHMCMHIVNGNITRVKEISFQDFNYAKLYDMHLGYTFCDITSILSKLED